MLLFCHSVQVTDPRFAAATPAEFADLISAWPTFATQAITVTEMADDWSWVVVRLDLTPSNANYFGTAFGGSLFSMLDPFLAICLVQRLGEGYVVWDRRAEIDFERPGTGPVTGVVRVTDEIVAEVREAASGGAKVLRWFEIDLTADDGTVVARQRRQIYVRRAPGLTLDAISPPR